MSAPAPERPYHVARGQQRGGPYTLAQLREMAAAGQLAPTDLVVQEGGTAWAPASSLPGLFAPAAPVLERMATPPPAAPAAVLGQGLWGRVRFHAGRALEWNLRTVPVLPEEEAELVKVGVDDLDARRYHAWRRSVLLVILFPTLLTGVISAITTLSADEAEYYSPFGNFAAIVRIVALFVMPATAWRAARAWSRHKRSRQILVRGWAIVFLTPLILALFPVQWRYKLDEGSLAQAEEAALRMRAAMSYYVTLTPAVLALIPGILRACLRVKLLLPQSILPGWFLVAATPLYMLFFMVAFVTINQLAGNLLLVVGVLAITGGPVLYMVHGAVFVRPVSSPADEQRMIRVQKQVRWIMMGGGVCMLIYLFTAKIFGMSIIGTDTDTSLVRPWNLNLIEFPVEYLGRSLFTTSCVADLFMMMNLSVWQHSREFAKSPAAAQYDRLMSEIEEAGGRE